MDREGASLIKATLVCTSGPLAGRIFNMEGERVFIFGRHPKVTYNLAIDPSISQLHFLIDTSDNRIRIIDIGSTNGLMVNNTLYGGRAGITPVPFVVLEHGDIVMAGSNHFRVDLPGAPEEDIQELLEPWIAIPPVPPERYDSSATTPQGAEEASASAKPRRADTATIINPSRFPAIKGYTIIEKIYQNDSREVYKAIRDQNGEKAAIAVLLAETVGNRSAVDSFLREIQINQQLVHPNIVRYLEDGMVDSAPYMALEYVAGGTLEQLLHGLPDGRMSYEQVVPLFTQLLEAVGHMHRMGLAHKDIKPENILLDPRRGGGMAPKLSGLGLAGHVSGEAGDFTPGEGIVHACMPPELVEDITKTLPQSDVFGVAATVYHMLSGRMMYDLGTKDLAMSIIKGEIFPILILRSELPGRFVKVIDKALAHSPEGRYADAEAMLAALQDALS